MLLQQNEVNIISIRDFLGHASVTTTEIYARIDNKLKREALENKPSTGVTGTSMAKQQRTLGLA